MGIATFTIIGLAGLAFLLLTVFVDGIFDIFEGEPILPSIAFFATMFGFTGALAASVSDGNPGTFVAIGLGVGAISAALFFISYKAMKKQDDSDFEPDHQTLVGLTGRVDTWHGNSGDVIVSFLGQPTSFHAVAANGETFRARDVVIVEQVNGKTITVRPVSGTGAEI